MAEADDKGPEAKEAVAEFSDSPNAGEVELSENESDEPTADRDTLDIDEADEVDTPEEAEKNLG